MSEDLDYGDVDPDAHAVVVQLDWSDGMRHRFLRKEDGSWDLILTGTGEHLPAIKGYKRKDIDRVLGTALKDTLDDRNHDEEPVDDEIPLTKESARTLWKAIHGDRFTPTNLDKALKELHDHGIGDL